MKTLALSICLFLPLTAMAAEKLLPTDLEAEIKTQNSSTASELVKENPNQKTLYSPELKSNITSRCSSLYYLEAEPAIINKMNAFAEKSIIEGIANVAKYNPPLACEIKRRLPKKPFLLLCEGNAHGGSAATKANLLFSLGIGKFSHKIVDSGLVDYFHLLAMLKKDGIQEQYFTPDIADAEINERNSILHEVLHVIGIKNQSMWRHNHPTLTHPLDRDIVESCAGMAFVSQINKFTAADGKSKYMSHEMCITCASFKIKGECASASATLDPEVVCKGVEDLLSL